MNLLTRLDKTFAYNDNNIRTVKDVWFVAKDICNLLGLKNITTALKFIPDKWKSVEHITCDYNNHMIIINTAAFYKLILDSKDENFNYIKDTIYEKILTKIDDKFIRDFLNRDIRRVKDNWFVAKDVCTVLGLKNITVALKFIPSKWKSFERVKGDYNIQNMTTINISAIYKLILDSKNENFNDFRDNVYENILTNMDDDFIYECLINDENVMKKDDIELSEENTDTEDIIITEENRNKETLNIVELIQDKPIIKLENNTYQNKLINKIKNNFNTNEQQLFVASFYCYLNYDKNDFNIDLDDIWRWLGYTRKNDAKRILEKYFTIDIDYTVKKTATETSVAVFKSILKNEKTAPSIDGVVFEPINGGQNKETILLTINTFKKFCLKAGTKKADEIHDYYIKLEELLHETLCEETNELRLELENKNNKIILISKELHDEQVKIVKQQNSLLYQQEKVTNRYKLSQEAGIYVVYDPSWRFSKYKIGKTGNLDNRFTEYRTMAPNLKIKFIMYTHHYDFFETAIKIKFAEYLEMPSHEILIIDIDQLINGIKEINKVNNLNAVIEEELWKFNNEEPPMFYTSKKQELIIPAGGQSKEIKLNLTSLPITKKDIPIPHVIRMESNKQSIDDCFLPKRLLLAEYTKMNEEAKENYRFCNSFCQQYKLVSDFSFVSQYLSTCCNYCKEMEELARHRISTGLYTASQIASNPSLVFLEENEKICLKCNKIKDKKFFDKTRRQCKQCRTEKRNQFACEFENIIDEVIEEIEYKLKSSLSDNEKYKIVEIFTKDQIHLIAQKLGITRKFNDNLHKMRLKVINFFENF